jgi:hypothetical protein
MCNRCSEIDAQIARYRNIVNGINDKSVIERLLASITEMHSEKITLHSMTAKK